MKKDIARIWFERKGDTPVLWETFSQELLPDGRQRLFMRQGNSPHEHLLPARKIDEAIASFFVESEAVGGLGLFPGEKISIEILGSQENDVEL